MPNSETRRAEPHDLAPVELPNLRAPRLPTFFADPITGSATELPVELDTVPDNAPPDGDSDYPEPDDSFLSRYTYDPVTGGVFDEFGRVR